MRTLAKSPASVLAFQMPPLTGEPGALANPLLTYASAGIDYVQRGATEMSLSTLLRVAPVFCCSNALETANVWLLFGDLFQEFEKLPCGHDLGRCQLISDIQEIPIAGNEEIGVRVVCHLQEIVVLAVP